MIYLIITRVHTVNIIVLKLPLLHLLIAFTIHLKTTNICNYYLLTAAFYTIDFTILLSRLSNIGITTAFNWFKSFITTRTYSVKINFSFSQSYPLNLGVPQLWDLKVLFFLQFYFLYIYDIYQNYSNHILDYNIISMQMI